MEKVDPTNPITPVSERPKKRWTLPKILAVLALTIMVFAAGAAVGRGDLQLRGLSVTKNKPSPASLDYSSIDQIYGLLKSDFDGSLDNQKLIDGLKAGLVEAAGDPYTVYFNAEEAKTFNEELSGSFTGIGAELGTDEDSNIVIVSPLSGYPAEKAGLKPKDIIGAINGETTVGMPVDKAVQKIRGPADTQVKLIIVRGTDKPFEVTITRQQINVATVKSSGDGAIGYLKITQFTGDTTKLAKDAIADFKNKGVKAVILDLRGNPGGYLSGAVDISSFWLDKKQVVVSQKRGEQTLSTEYAKSGATLGGVPTVVLIDGGSASASEITAGALRDNGAATTLGEKSFGKGSVQQVECLGIASLTITKTSDTCEGPMLKVTIARWFTPKGANIDKQGITPDVAVTISDEDQKAGRDPQKDKATEILRSKIQ